MLFLIISLFVLSVSSIPTCPICKNIITTLSEQLDNTFTEAEVAAYLKVGCNTFGLQSWCEDKVYPNVHEIFLALQSNKTDDIVCERIALCKFKVTYIDGDILFADRDTLYTIQERADHSILHTHFATVAHPEIPNGIISGLSCGVDYCAVLISLQNTDGSYKYGTTALSPYDQVHQVLPSGDWYGPWMDIMTEEFWMATGTASHLVFGIFDPQFGSWRPKITMRLLASSTSELLSGQILDRILYFTLRDNPHVYLLDLTLRISRGNFSAPNNTMLVGNPVSNILYGYAPSPQGIWRWDNATHTTRTTVATINLTGATPIASSTISPVKNTMWISVWSGQDLWLRVDLTKDSDNIAWAPSGDLDGLFDFNPYTIRSEQV